MNEARNLLAAPMVKLLKAYADAPRGCLLISGPPASSLDSAVGYLLKAVYGRKDGLEGQVYLMEDKSIEAVRRILSLISKSRFDESQPRLLVVNDCHRLTLEAQNALLKSLEEPPEATHFVLISTRPEAILPTIVSRCQIIKMRKPAKEKIFRQWPDEDEAELEKAYWAADGWPSLMDDYLSDPESRIQKEIGLAKDFLQRKTRHQKLKFLLGNERPKIEDESQKELDLGGFLELLLSGLWRTSRAALFTVAQQDQPDKMASWHRRFAEVNALKLDAERGLNPKILALCLSLRA